jgi:hypothetical protein
MDQCDGGGKLPLTLSSYTAVSNNPYPLPHPVIQVREILVGFAPFMLLLELVHPFVVFGDDERAHEDPF